MLPLKKRLQSILRGWIIDGIQVDNAPVEVTYSSIGDVMYVSNRKYMRVTIAASRCTKPDKKKGVKK